MFIDLKVGDRVVTLDGDHGTVRRISLNLPDEGLRYGVNLDGKPGMWWYTDYSVKKEKY